MKSRIPEFEFDVTDESAAFSIADRISSSLRFDRLVCYGVSHSRISFCFRLIVRFDPCENNSWQLRFASFSLVSNRLGSGGRREVCRRMELSPLVTGVTRIFATLYRPTLFCWAWVNGEGGWSLCSFMSLYALGLRPRIKAQSEFWNHTFPRLKHPLRLGLNQFPSISGPFHVFLSPFTLFLWYLVN